MAKCTFKKTKKGFAYGGDFGGCICVAQQKIKKLQQDTPYILRLFKEVERRYKAHFNAMADAKEFISIAEEKIEADKKQAQEALDDKESN